MEFGTRRDRRVYPKRGKPDLDDLIRQLDGKIKAGARADYPRVIVFDWNGTIDARGHGIGIPAEVLFALKRLGKTVIIYTSSVEADRKLFMRKWAEDNGIPYTDKMKILKDADMFVGDKHSDEKHAGRYGVNFVYVKDFSMEKVLPRAPTSAAKTIEKVVPPIVEKVVPKILPKVLPPILPKIRAKARATITHPQDQSCTCEVEHPGTRHERLNCKCKVTHPLGGEIN